MSGRRELNPQHFAWEANILPLNYSRLRPPGRTSAGDARRIRESGLCRQLFILVDLGGVEPPPLQCECSVVPLDYRPKIILQRSGSNIDFRQSIYFCQHSFLQFKQPNLSGLSSILSSIYAFIINWHIKLNKT